MRMADANPLNVCYGPERRPWRESLSEVAVTTDGELLVTQPTCDPLQLESYPEVADITSSWYQVPSTSLSHDQRKQALDQTSTAVHKGAARMLGFQGSEKFDYPILKEYSNCYLDNEGDPFSQAQTHTVHNTKWLERNVLDYFASLWHAKWPHDPNDPESYWGYIAGIGSTEGNMFAIMSARDYLTGMFFLHVKQGEGDPRLVPTYIQGRCLDGNNKALKPVCFFSADSHFGIPKCCQVCNVSTFYDVGIDLYPDENPLGGIWPYDVSCENGDAGPGSIDINALAKLVDFFSGKGHPIMVIFNYGSTFKGAYDDVKATEDALLPILKKNGMYERKLYLSKDPAVCVTRKGFWFHVDGALSSAYIPFIEMGYKQGLIKDAPGPIFDFRLESVSSIVTGTSKWIGAPWPSGIYLTKTGLQVRAPSERSCLEPMFLGSRNAHVAILLWSHISSHSFDDEIKKVIKALSVANYAEKQLRALQKEIQTDLWISRTKLSLAILFKRPNQKIFSKYLLSSKTLYFDGELREYCHIYIMHHVEKDLIDQLIKDLHLPGAFSK